MSFDRLKFFQELHDIILGYLTEKQITFRNPCANPTIFFVELKNINNAILEAELRGGFGIGIVFSIKPCDNPSDLYIANEVTSWNVGAGSHEPFKLLEDKKLIHEVLDMIFVKANSWEEGEVTQ